MVVQAKDDGWHNITSHILEQQQGYIQYSALSTLHISQPITDIKIFLSLINDELVDHINTAFTAVAQHHYCGTSGPRRIISKRDIMQTIAFYMDICANQYINLKAHLK